MTRGDHFFLKRTEYIEVCRTENFPLHYFHVCVCATETQNTVTAGHLSKHHDGAVGVKEARGVSLVQSHLCFHCCPGAATEGVLLSLRAGTL